MKYHDKKDAVFEIIETLMGLKFKPLKPIALRKAKTVYNFGLSGCNWVNDFSHSDTSTVLSLPQYSQRHIQSMCHSQ